MHIRIQLLKPHPHTGRPYAAGDRLDLDDDLAEWLITLRVARALSASPKSHPQPEPKDPE